MSYFNEMVRSDATSPGETKITILGLGYVGCVSAACFASLGYKVTGVDPDEFKVRSVLESEAPFFEPGLEELIVKGIASGNLSATTSIEQGLQDADVALICVGTPSERNGNLSLTVLRMVSEQIGKTLPGRSKPLIVVIRSTVFPGTCEEVVMPHMTEGKAVVVANPEFLREGSAVKDFFEPSLIVVGGDDQQAVRKIADLYGSLGVEPALVSLRTAEMIKYTCNCFHAVKISFANEIGAISERLGVDGQEVMETVCRDVKLNVSPAYLKPGFAFGGSCLPKDLRALVYRASRLDMRLPMLQAVLPSNEEHLRRACDEVMERPGRVGIYGLAFKENTDDVRESPTISLIEYLVGKGRELKVYDPHIRLEQIYGSNRNFLLSALPHVGKLMEPELAHFLDWSETIVVAQKPSAEMQAKLAASGKPLVNLVGAKIARTSEEPS